ncbi:AAA family ATPase [Paenibacillus sp. FSL L8-0435]|uniref:AAA family ATPase n=1 Tax=Paenibacillus sp. FSL L8-0435 TaxID=2954618 RepID=UPI0030D6D481
MYIYKVEIEKYRNFREKEVTFNDGLNVIIGHNNAGKTNLINALALILNSNGKKRLEIYDFNKNTSL